VLVVTIDRPDARNAVDPDVARAVEAALDTLEGDDTLWTGVLAGAGPVFCAGADLRSIADGNAAELSTGRGGFAGIVTRARAKPLIAAVDGPALAGGFEIVLACDLVVASSAASFALPEVKRSLLAGGGGLFRLPRAIPRHIAIELALTGEAIDAARAHALGLVSRLAAPGEAIDAAVELAATINANAPLAVRASRRLIIDSLLATDADAIDMVNGAYRALADSEDFQEGPRSFLEKRAPRWTGR
jgi:enoyl-CoA hydratase